jgi:undecaprenyl diphosphate synthase
MKITQYLKRYFAAPTKQILINPPKHVAIIMDGNGRWAKQRGLPRTAGHKVGLDRVQDAVEVCLEVGIKHLTLYAFSTENWSRPSEEVNFLMNLFKESIQKHALKLHENGIKIRFIGSKKELDPSLIKMMEENEKLTAQNEALILNIAINYGGRAELLLALKGIGREVQRGSLNPEQLNEAEIEKHLYTAGQPDPDLLIKPGGEYRISNFLIWQMAYTEFYFTKLYWPDFGKTEMMKAFHEFSQRERRFGGIRG